MKSEILAQIHGPLVMVGFGSIGKGALPLILRHIKFDLKRMTVIDPKETNKRILEQQGIRFRKVGLTEENYREILTPLLTEGEGQGFLVNLSVNTSSVDLLKFCREIKTLYIDTVIEPWQGFYFNREVSNCERSNYMLREELMAEKRASPGGTTAVSCCGANPGMVSWFLKRALLIIAKDVGLACKEPATRAEWGALAMALGVEGIHIAERDTQTTGTSKPHYSFWNTWSVEGFLSEAMQPAELGWGTHEKWMPEFARQHEVGSRAAIYLDKPGAKIKVRSWCPTPGPQFAFLVTHNESISISDYFTVRAEDGAVAYRPTCHYAYHPCDQAILSIFDMLGSGISPDKVEEELILDEQDIIEGMDELGVLVYGHKKNAYWYGSRLTIEQTRALAPYQNATGLQVTSAVLAGIVWALEHPARGIVEADEMDYQRCLQVQEPYLGQLFGEYTDWTPLKGQLEFFPEEMDEHDPWQFKNVMML